jgi:hypothetical protein
VLVKPGLAAPTVTVSGVVHATSAAGASDTTEASGGGGKAVKTKSKSKTGTLEAFLKKPAAGEAEAVNPAVTPAKGTSTRYIDDAYCA